MEISKREWVLKVSRELKDGVYEVTHRGDVVKVVKISSPNVQQEGKEVDVEQIDRPNVEQVDEGIRVCNTDEEIASKIAEVVRKKIEQGWLERTAVMNRKEFIPNWRTGLLEGRFECTTK